MTTAERIEVLDERLRRGYETFDGFILGERERAQTESNAAGSAQPGADSGGAGGGGQNLPQIVGDTSGAPNSAVVAGAPVSSSTAPTETFPPPEDIPSGRDDDVVARQIREAAMTEPDPALREAIWEEYRRYTGLSKEE
jgi:hypothetical protein